jgi:RNA polymerase sigma-70 factor (ECF subfamily)
LTASTYETKKTLDGHVDARRIDPSADTHPELDRLDLDGAPREAAHLRVPISFEQLYREYFNFTFRTLRHLGVPAPALPDAVQEVWLAVHRQLAHFEGRSSYQTWLFSIALNTARNQRRSRQRHERCAELPDDLPTGDPDPEQRHSEREALTLVQEFMATLDEARRVLFISQLLEELNADETAQLLGIERASVYHRVRDLRRAFKRWVLARQGVSQ